MRPPRKLITPSKKNQNNATAGRAFISEKAKIRARTTVGQKLTITDSRVLERGLIPCIPTLANIAALPNPKPDSRERAIASIAAAYPYLSSQNHQDHPDYCQQGSGDQLGSDLFQSGQEEVRKKQSYQRAT